MPALGESVTEGTITRWLKAEGDEVAVDEPLLEVSTDKVDTEIPSPVAGTLSKILVQEDETVAVGADLAVVGGSGVRGLRLGEERAGRAGSRAAEEKPRPSAGARAPAAQQEPEAPQAEEPEAGPEPEPAAAEESRPPTPPSSSRRPRTSPRPPRTRSPEATAPAPTAGGSRATPRPT